VHALLKLEVLPPTDAKVSRDLHGREAEPLPISHEPRQVHRRHDPTLPSESVTAMGLPELTIHATNKLHPEAGGVAHTY
jgi:hypothetical protein